MSRYTIAETFLYEVTADTPQEAVELFHEFMESGDSEATGVTFADNELATYNESGAEV